MLSSVNIGTKKSTEYQDLLHLCTEVVHDCKTLIKNAERPHKNVVHNLNLIVHLIDCTKFTHHLNDISSFAGNYDFYDIKANGYRSFLSIVNYCLLRIHIYVRELKQHPMLKWQTPTSKQFITYVRCLMELSQCICLLHKLPVYSAFHSCLFPHSSYSCLPPSPCESILNYVIEDNLKEIDKAGLSVSCSDTPVNPQDHSLDTFIELMDGFDDIQQEYFYGTCIGFYFAPLVQKLFNVISSAMAGFADSFEQRRVQGFTGFITTFYHTIALHMSPEQRGRKIAEATRNYDVNYCKSFWSLLENPLLIGSAGVLLPNLALVRTFIIAEQLLHLKVRSYRTESQSETLISISSPGPFNVRLLSKHLYRGMNWLMKCKLSHKNSQISSSEASDTALPVAEGVDPTASPYLLVHFHGGGFIALNSESHDIYLKNLAEFLDCPILSVNYSLAPEYPYPRALNECLYAYCWAVLNRTLLGCQPDAKIVICGDSAGGNLTLSVCLRAIHLDLLDQPFGAFIAYAPTLISYVPTPSRMLSLCDPLLPIGILTRCMLAYSGINEKDYLQTISNNTTSTPRKGNSLTLSKLNGSHLSNSSSTFSFKNYFGQSSTNDLDLSISLSNSEQAVIETGSESVVSNHSIYAAKTKSYGSSSFTRVDDILKHSSSEERPSLFRYLKNCPIPQDEFLSPYFARNDLLSRLPPLGIVACHFDPFLDDCLELAKRADRVGVPVELLVFDGLPHGFLNLGIRGSHFQEAKDECNKLMLRLLQGEVKPYKPVSS